MDIRILDHIIVGGDSYFSFAEKRPPGPLGLGRNSNRPNNLN